MQIDKNKTYELHRPREMGDAMGLEQIKRLLSREEFAKYMEARERAGTAGPMMIGGRVSTMPGEKVDEVYAKALLEGANPCYVDEETGQVFLGHYVFVPAPEDD